MIGRLVSIIRSREDQRVVCTPHVGVKVIDSYKINLTRNRFAATIYCNATKELVCVL